MMQGSTVTYRSHSFSTSAVYFGLSGSSSGTTFGVLMSCNGVGDKIEAMAWNSACRVPFMVRFVAFMPRAMILPSCTKTHATGVSSVSRAN